VTRQFCTLFDSNYLFKALALYDSLDRHYPSFHLAAFCFDEESERVLRQLALPKLSTVSLAELERRDPDLEAVKGTRNRLEYCCTATPALPLHIFATRPEVAEVTYLDADLFFFGAPDPLFREMGEASVLITPHRFPPHLRHHEINGIYNVQFMTFRRDQRGLACLRWWHDRCIEWCYFRLDGDRFADQKYLDDWPDRFEGVHVLRHKGGGLGPWNVSGYQLREEHGIVMVDEDPLVFFHFHRVRLRDDDGYEWRAPGYPIPARARELVYTPYLAALDEAKARVWAVEPGFRAGLAPFAVRDRLRDARAEVGARLASLLVRPGAARR
jgi:hypothetical protein